MSTLLDQLINTYPTVQFLAGKQFFWSPESQKVFYEQTTQPDQQWDWRLLHETGHALLQHRNYRSDVELLQMEVAAWKKAQEIATNFDITIDQNYCEDCLDTYRDWLYKRSTCPKCHIHSLQESINQYRCHNCNSIWQVTRSRFCRPYRTLVSSN